MKLSFLGTGTSMGVPVAGGFSYDSPVQTLQSQPDVQASYRCHLAHEAV